jgi:ankyrin repeat protein
MNLDPVFTVSTVADMDWLLMSGADVHATDAFGNTPLHVYAIQHPFPEKYGILRLLMMHGAKADAKNDIWRTPLHGAVWAGDAGAVDILARSCDLRRTMDEEGVTPSDMAVEREEKEVIEVLKKHARDRAVTAILSLCYRGVDHQSAGDIARRAFFEENVCVT